MVLRIHYIVLKLTDNLVFVKNDIIQDFNHFVNSVAGINTAIKVDNRERKAADDVRVNKTICLLLEDVVIIDEVVMITDVLKRVIQPIIDAKRVGNEEVYYQEKDAADYSKTNLMFAITMFMVACIETTQVNFVGKKEPNGKNDDYKTVEMVLVIVNLAYNCTKKEAKIFVTLYK